MDRLLSFFARRGPHPFKVDYRLLLAWIAAVFVVVAAHFVHLGEPTLWNDEADTAILARTVRTHGVPIAYDGRNLSVYQECSQLGRGLLSSKLPWMQYYVGALSQAVFGGTTFGSRFLFALLGAASLLPMVLLLRTRVPHPLLLSTLLLLTPQVLLFNRNARYYPIVLLLYLWLLVLWQREGPPTRWRYVGAALLAAALFHTHPFIAVGVFAALALVSLVRRHPARWLVLAAGGFGAITWGAWFQYVGSISPEEVLPGVALLSNAPGVWATFFITGLWLIWRDFDYANVAPTLVWVVALGWALARHRAALRGLVSDPLLAAIVVNLLVQAVMIAAIIGYETTGRNLADHYSPLRYMPHLV
ncbi:MAG: hypothetical protein MUF54_03180, partial [Polyangiaceae bacterium]|nr:hypothetical protein [Polyangiaceae bacterium]